MTECSSTPSTVCWAGPVVLVRAVSGRMVESGSPATTATNPNTSVILGGNILAGGTFKYLLIIFFPSGCRKCKNLKKLYMIFENCLNSYIALVGTVHGM